MLSPQALFRGITSRILPSAWSDNPQVDVPARMGRYGEQYGLSLVRKQHLLADEGGYFTCNNRQAAGITIPNITSSSTTQPCFIIANTDSPANPNYKRIYLDYLSLLVTSAATAASGLISQQFAFMIDSVNRIQSSGTNLTPNITNVNMDAGTQSIAAINFGTPVSNNITLNRRFVVALRTARIAVSATVLNLVNETLLFSFGGAEFVNFAAGAGGASQQVTQLPMPPVVIGPGQSAMLLLWSNNAGTPVAPAYAPEIGWWER